MTPAAGTASASAHTGTPTAPARVVVFTEVAATQNSRYDDDAPAVMVGASSAAAATIAARVPQASASSGRVLIAAFQGAKRTGGYAIHIDAIERDGDQLIVHATFTQPAPGSLVTQVLTSPAHVVSVAAADIAGARVAILLDRSGSERARDTIT